MNSWERLRLLQLKRYLKAKEKKRYCKIDGVSYTQVAFKKLDGYLRFRRPRFSGRKSQRKAKLNGQQAYEHLTLKYGVDCSVQVF